MQIMCRGKTAVFKASLQSGCKKVQKEGLTLYKRPRENRALRLNRALFLPLIRAFDDSDVQIPALVSFVPMARQPALRTLPFARQ